MVKLSDLKEGDEAYIKVQLCEDTKDGTSMPIKIKFSKQVSKQECNLVGWAPDLPVKRVEEIEDVKPKIKVPKKVAEELDRNKLHKLAATWFEGKFVIKYPNLMEWINRNIGKYPGFDKFSLLCLLKLNGYEVEEEKGVVLIDVPNPYFKYVFISQNDIDDKYIVSNTDTIRTILRIAAKLTEEEAIDKFPNCRWVALEELESEE